MQDLRGERLQIMLTPEELSLIDDFRFLHRMPTRAAAVRELLSPKCAKIERTAVAPARARNATAKAAIDQGRIS